MTQEEVDKTISQIKDKWVGKQVKVKGKTHPHAGEIGEVIDFRHADLIGKYGLVVKSELSDFFVFDVKELFVIP